MSNAAPNFTVFNAKTRMVKPGTPFAEAFLLTCSDGPGLLSFAQILTERGVFVHGDWVVWEDDKSVSCQGAVDLFYNDHIPSWAADLLIDLSGESEVIKKQSHDFVSDAYGP